MRPEDVAAELDVDALIDGAIKSAQGNGYWPDRVVGGHLIRHALAAVVPEIQAQALREAAEEMDLPGSTATGYYASEAVGGYNDAERDIEAWLVKRAARLTATTEGPTMPECSRCHGRGCVTVTSIACRGCCPDCHPTTTEEPTA